MFQCLLPGTHPFSPWCEGLWVQSAALLEGLECLDTTGEHSRQLSFSEHVGHPVLRVQYSSRTDPWLHLALGRGLGERLQNCTDLTAGTMGSGVWHHTECIELNNSDNPFGYSWTTWKSGWVEHLAALQEFCSAWGSCVHLWRPKRYLLQKHISNARRRCAVN